MGDGSAGVWRWGWCGVQLFVCLYTVTSVTACSAFRSDNDGRSAPVPVSDVSGPRSQGAEILDVSVFMDLGPGDVFEVKVFQDEALSSTFMVDHDGTIDFPFIGSVNVASRTPNQVAEEIRRRLAEGYVRDPVVNVFVKKTNSKKVFVFGQVRKPGTFGFESNMNIVQAITLAGGFTEVASRDATRVTRLDRGVERRYTVPISKILDGARPNFALRPGDIVFIPESIF